VEGAAREYRAALRIDPNYAKAHNNLGTALADQKDLDGAVRAYRAALRIDPNYAKAHYNLGTALRAKEDLEGAVREYRAALGINPKFAQAHFNLGFALHDQKDLEGAIRAYRAGLAIDPGFDRAHYGLGLALHTKKDLEGAAREYRAAFAINPNYAPAHYNLGNILLAKKDLEGAAREYRAALKINPNHAEANCNLGQVLVAQGRFTDAVASLNTGHRLGTQRAGWPYDSAAWVREAERLVRLDAKLSKVLNGDGQPADAAERLQLAWLCQRPYKQLDAAAARFFREAFAAEPKRSNDLRAGHRYNAACAAARAGCGQSKNAAGLGEQERARLRRQALDWLRADLAAWGERLDGQTDPAPTAVLRKMAHWEQDADLAGVRRPEALTRLPEAERRGWQQLWADVEALRQRAAEMN
jgi:tetratricopeptide (TPR) repeat protein